MHNYFIILLFVFSLCFSQQQINETIFFDGLEREFIVYIPASYNGNTEFPLLFSFHGGSGYASDFIQSWKDTRKPITINVSGAPPIGFYHKERRCKTCNGRVILTTPAHCKVETVQCPHCKNGKIEVNE